MNFKLLFVLYCFVLISCDDKQQDFPILDQESNDTTGPSISISPLGDVLEVLTSVSVSLSDESEIANTIILINEKEVLNSSEKDFQFEIDPFEFPNGETTLTIKTTDKENNESIESYMFQLRKLLYRQKSGFSSNTVDSYLAINLEQSGDLIAFKKINTIEDPIFYATDDFEKQKIVITKYLISKMATGGFNLARSAASFLPGTTLLTTQEIAEKVGLEHINYPRDSEFDVLVEDAPFVNRFSLLGIDFSFNTGNSPNLKIEYNQERTEDIFLYHNNTSNSDLIDHYRFHIIDEFQNKTINYSELDSLSEKDIATVTLPDAVIDYGVTLFGYNNNEDYKEGVFRLLYSHATETSVSGFRYNLPVIGKYPILEQRLNVTLFDGRKISFDFKGLSDVAIPDLTIQQLNGMIHINGEYDFSNIALKVNHPDPESNTTFLRNYNRVIINDSLRIPYETLEIPAEIVEQLNNQGFTITSKDTSGEMSLQLTQFENQMNYPNGAFYSPLRNEAGDRTVVTFPLN